MQNRGYTKEVNLYSLKRPKLSRCPTSFNCPKVSQRPLSSIRPIIKDIGQLIFALRCTGARTMDRFCSIKVYFFDNFQQVFIIDISVSSKSF